MEVNEKRYLARCNTEAERLLTRYALDLILLDAQVISGDEAKQAKDKLRSNWMARQDFAEGGDEILRLLDANGDLVELQRIFDMEFGEVRFWMLSHIRSAVRRAQRAQNLAEMESNPLFGMF
ncbi:hypothetical protein [Paracoccus litorisediminis]|uniref:Uncharacterized protein n=1 Tax=Paracoccus litorisediminis TaxID=2006130 RepID=A0A844HU90_9RHOB|nr:hypothetical protein [Paracoccus litorisediminis]MTH61141.1 hypothetical protein [Paracoccus litorisediminis]